MQFCVLTCFVIFALSFQSVFAFETIKIGEGRYVTFDHVKVKDATDTVILLPGINRSLSPLSERSYFTALKNEKLNVVSLATSCHPQSVSQIPEGESFAAALSVLTSQDLAAEVEAVVKYLKLKKPFVASLSYSSSILSALDPKLFGGFIETVPMGDPLEGMSTQVKLARDSQDWLKLTNPFFGPGIVRTQRDTAYRAQWKNLVEQRLEEDSEFYGPNPNVENIIEGYVSLARAAEDYRITKTSLAVPRIWVLASDEQAERFQLQIQAVQADFKKFKGNAGLLIVSNSAHVLPSDQPQAAARSLLLGVEMLKSREFVSGILVGTKLTEFTEEQRKELGLE